MKNVILALALLVAPAFAQNVTRWSATTGNVSLTSSATAATVQQPASGAKQVTLEMIVVYCSVTCPVTLLANGTGATTTAGTVQALLPAPLNATSPFNFFTASNASGGTQQGGIVQVPAGVPYVICLNTSCGMPQSTYMTGAGTNINYTASIGSVTGTVNLTFFAETR